jgi:hypothetical protein
LQQDVTEKLTSRCFNTITITYRYIPLHPLGVRYPLQPKPAAFLPS